MERKFAITMHAPLGSREGLLYFTEHNGKINGILDILGCSQDFSGTMNSFGELIFSGKIISAVKSFSYCATGKITDNNLELKVKGDRYDFRITGKEIKTHDIGGVS